MAHPNIRNHSTPQSVYEHIQGYQEEKVHAQEPAPMADASRSPAAMVL